KKPNICKKRNIWHGLMVDPSKCDLFYLRKKACYTEQHRETQSNTEKIIKQCVPFGEYLL
ncbi:MAG TPA: hypothetical protein PLH09_02610, partial [Lentimicrobium sp.]|nr:hypothetical protein [Lentimicrobium sp.]